MNQKKRNQNFNRHDRNGKRLRNLRSEDYKPLNDSLKNIYLTTQRTEQYDKPPKTEASEV